MQHLDALCQALPEAAADIASNIQTVLQSEHMTPAQAMGTALASAWFLRADALAQALLKDCEEAGVDAGLIDDARAAAIIMGMNTRYYRFRHVIPADSPFAKMPARLRMMRASKPTSDKATFELMSMSCAGLAACEMCVDAHLKALLKEQVAPEAIHDSIRIGAVVNGLAVAMGVGS